MVLVTWVLCGLSGWVQRELDPPRQLAALAGLVGAHGRRCSAPLLSVSVGRGQHGGGRSVSREPDRAGPSRRPGGAMWFMYVLSWLSLFIQVAFITLAVGESADLGRAPRCPEFQLLLRFAAGCGRPRAGPAGPRPNLPEGTHGLRGAALLSEPWAAPSACPLQPGQRRPLSVSPGCVLAYSARPVS